MFLAARGIYAGHVEDKQAELVLQQLLSFLQSVRILHLGHVLPVASDFVLVSAVQADHGGGGLHGGRHHQPLARSLREQGVPHSPGVCCHCEVADQVL